MNLWVQDPSGDQFGVPYRGIQWTPGYKEVKRVSKSISDTQTILFHEDWSVIGDIMPKQPAKTINQPIGTCVHPCPPEDRGHPRLCLLRVLEVPCTHLSLQEPTISSWISLEVYLWPLAVRFLPRAIVPCGPIGFPMPQGLDAWKKQ